MILRTMYMELDQQMYAAINLDRRKSKNDSLHRHLSGEDYQNEWIQKFTGQYSYMLIVHKNKMKYVRSSKA